MMKEFNFTTTPIVNIVNEIIIDSVIRNASDIHFDPAEDYLKIRIRIDGELRDYTLVDNRYKRNLTTRIKLLAGMNITESRLPQDGAIKSVIEGKDLDLRVSALPTSFGEKIVIRILDYSMSLQGIETLGFTGDNYNAIMEMLANPNGIILITGATGSGKSTTVYSMLQKLNREEVNIITVEDPVEMSIEGLNQVQVNSEIGLDFATVLRSILRQDPNVILIGEIRDSETAKIAVRASITGHLVLSTLHTNNSITTIERLVDMDVERYLLSSSLKGIISQTLAKRLCPYCRIQRPANDTEKTLFKKALGVDIETIFEAGRCEHCHNGYTGRIALQEVLVINEEIRDAINRNMDREQLKDLIYRKNKNVKNLLQDGLIKVMEGITDLKEVFRLVDNDDYDDISGTMVSDEDGSNNEVNQDEIKNNTLLASDNQNVTPENKIIESNDSNNNQNVTPENIIVESSNSNDNQNDVPISNNQNNVSESIIVEHGNSNNVQNVVPIPNTQNVSPNNGLLESNQTNPSFNTSKNLFDDDVFKALMADNQNQNNQVDTTNYTNNLVNMINQNINQNQNQAN